MDLSILSDEILIRIFNNLPFKNLVHIGRVNNRWYEISKELITKNTIVLDFKDPLFHKLTSESLKALLTLCSMNLRRIVVPPSDFKRTEIFGGFEYPNLVQLDMRGSFYSSSTLGSILKNARNLQVLKYGDGSADIGSIVLDHLGTLVAASGGDLAFLIGRVPNVRYLELEQNDDRSDYVRNFNDFIAKCPAIDTIKCNYLKTHRSFWRLDLRHLFIGDFDDLTTPFDRRLLKIGQVFRNLETLELGVCVTSQGIAALGACKNLREVKLNNYCPSWIDEGIRELGHCQNLESLQICGHIRVETLINVVNEFHCLKVFTIFSIEASVDTASVIRLFRRFGTDLTIRVIDLVSAQRWLIDPVKNKLEQLKNEGHSLLEFKYVHSFEVGWR